MNNDPLQGILFNAHRTIRFRDPLTRSEKIIFVLKKLRNSSQYTQVKRFKQTSNRPTFSTNLMPKHITTATLNSEVSTSRSTRTIVVK